MQNIDTDQPVAEFDATAFHAAFDETTGPMLEQCREGLLEGPGTVSRENVVAQLMMDNLFPHPLDIEMAARSVDEVFKGRLTTEQKKALVEVASHMGPDWTQALYHAAVFMTKVV